MAGPKRKLSSQSSSKSKVKDEETKLSEEIHIGEDDGDETDSSVYSELDEGRTTCNFANIMISTFIV